MNRFTLLLACLVPMALHAQAPAPPPTQCGPPPAGALCVQGPWFDFGRVDVTTTTGAIVGRFTLQYPAGEEILARFDVAAPDGTRAAEVLVLSGADTVAARVPPEYQGDPVQLLNAPVLTAQLVASLLQLALPEGPTSVTAKREVRLAESRRYLVTATPASRAAYGAPWSVAGSVRPGARGEFTYTLTLRYRRVGPGGVADARESPPLKLEGTISFAARRARLPDTFDLAGWRIVRNGATLDEQPTLGALRRAVQPAAR
jgi:hypothetical protein